MSRKGDRKYRLSRIRCECGKELWVPEVKVGWFRWKRVSEPTTDLHRAANETTFHKAIARSKQHVR